MPAGETESNPSPWTTDSAMQHLIALINEHDRRYEQRFAAQEKAVEFALSAAEKAVSKAESASEKRFDSVNEFRNQQRDLITTFMPRIESEQRMQQNTESISELKDRLNLIAGNTQGRNDLWGYLVGAIGVVSGVVGIIIGTK